MSDLKFPKKRKTGKKLTTTKVQEYFNAAIRRRDNCCVMQHSPHAGQLEASHFFPVKANGALRFYPPNVHTQCTRHHFAEFHMDNPLPYTRWMQEHIVRFEWMETHRKRLVKYTQATLHTVMDLCLKDRLDLLTDFIEGLIGD